MSIAQSQLSVQGVLTGIYLDSIIVNIVHVRLEILHACVYVL